MFTIEQISARAKDRVQSTSGLGISVLCEDWVTGQLPGRSSNEEAPPDLRGCRGAFVSAREPDAGFDRPIRGRFSDGTAFAAIAQRLL